MQSVKLVISETAVQPVKLVISETAGATSKACDQ